MASILTHVNALGRDIQWPDYVEIVASGYVHGKKIHCRLGLDTAGEKSLFCLENPPDGTEPNGTYCIFGSTIMKQFHFKEIKKRQDLYWVATHLFYFAETFDLEVAVRYECKTGENHQRILPFNEVSEPVTGDVVICNGFGNTCTKFGFKHPPLKEDLSQYKDFDVETMMQHFEDHQIVGRQLGKTTKELEHVATETDKAFKTLGDYLTRRFVPTLIIVPEMIVMMQKVIPLPRYLGLQRPEDRAKHSESLILWLCETLGLFAERNVAFADIKAANIGVTIQEGGKPPKWCLIDVEEVRVYDKSKVGDYNVCTFPANTNTHYRKGPVAIANTAAAFIATCVQVLLQEDTPWNYTDDAWEQDSTNGFKFLKQIGELKTQYISYRFSSDPYRRRIYTLAENWNTQFSQLDFDDVDAIVSAAKKFYHSGFKDMTRVGI